jgi:K+:H+ antiporter
MNPLVAAAIVSIMLNPVLFRSLRERPAAGRVAEAAPPGAEETSRSRLGPHHRAVVVGHGPIGRAVARLLKERGIEPTIIEMNIETHRKLRAEGEKTVYGDANQREVLEKSGIAGAASLIMSASGAADSIEAIRIARQLNPDVHVVSRADFLEQTGALRKAGANEVFSGEGEVALAMTDSILRKLGATPEQLDQERERIRAEIFRQAG